jgi:sec-independent protein translocase protein TatB
MFGVGSGELLLVFVIGLIVLGPERLPKVAAQVGRWVARARRMANQLRYQLEQEIALEELRAKNEELRAKNEELRAKNSEASNAEAAGADAVNAEAAGAEPSKAGAANGTSAPAPSSAHPDGGAPRVESVASAEAENDAVPTGYEAPVSQDTARSAYEGAANVRPLGSAIAGTAPPRELRPIEVGEDEAEVVTAEPARSGKTGSAE